MEKKMSKKNLVKYILNFFLKVIILFFTISLLRAFLDQVVQKDTLIYDFLNILTIGTLFSELTYIRQEMRRIYPFGIGNALSLIRGKDLQKVRVCLREKINTKSIEIENLSNYYIELGLEKD